MVLAADDQGFAPACSHAPDPRRLLALPLALEVGEFADMVHLDRFVRTAQFAGVGEETIQQLTPRTPDARGLIVKGRRHPPLERDASPAGYQRPSSFPALHRDLKDLVGLPVDLVSGTVAPVHPGHAGSELLGQRLGQGLLHDPFQSVETVQVERQAVVLDGAPILQLTLLAKSNSGNRMGVPEMRPGLIRPSAGC